MAPPSAVCSTVAPPLPVVQPSSASGKLTASSSLVGPCPPCGVQVPPPLVVSSETPLRPTTQALPDAVAATAPRLTVVGELARVHALPPLDVRSTVPVLPTA